MRKITIKQMTESSNIAPRLIRGVINQLGGWEDYTRQQMVDIVNHGIDGGFNGFIYYVDTVKFFRKYRKEILALGEDQASDIYGNDKGVLEMFRDFKCMKDLEVTLSEMAAAIYTSKGELVDQIQNCLAWYAGEEVSRLYVDLCEQED